MNRIEIAWATSRCAAASGDTLRRTAQGAALHAPRCAFSDMLAIAAQGTGYPEMHLRSLLSVRFHLRWRAGRFYLEDTAGDHFVDQLGFVSLEWLVAPERR